MSIFIIVTCNVWTTSFNFRPKVAAAATHEILLEMRVCLGGRILFCGDFVLLLCDSNPLWAGDFSLNEQKILWLMRCPSKMCVKFTMLPSRLARTIKYCQRVKLSHAAAAGQRVVYIATIDYSRNKVTCFTLFYISYVSLWILKIDFTLAHNNHHTKWKTHNSCYLLL